MVRLRSVVLPAPGEDMRFTVGHAGWRAKSARLAIRGDVVLGEDRLEHGDALGTGVDVTGVVADVPVLVPRFVVVPRSSWS